MRSKALLTATSLVIILPAFAWSIDLSVPWVSQSPPGTSVMTSLNCGPTSVLMVLGYYNRSGPPTSANIMAVDSWLAGHYAPAYNTNNGNGSITGKAQLAAIAQNFSIDPQYPVFPNTTAENWISPIDPI